MVWLLYQTFNVKADCKWHLMAKYELQSSTCIYLCSMSGTIKKSLTSLSIMKVRLVLPRQENSKLCTFDFILLSSDYYPVV